MDVHKYFANFGIGGNIKGKRTFRRIFGIRRNFCDLVENWVSIGISFDLTQLDSA